MNKIQKPTIKIGIYFKVIVLILLTNTLLAQESKQMNYPFNQLKFSITPSLCSNLKTLDTEGAPILSSNPTFGVEATVSYYQQIVKWFGISLGVGINATPYSWHFTFIPNITNIESPYYQKEQKVKGYESMGLITIPLALCATIPIKSSSWRIDIQAGAKFNYIFNSWDSGINYESEFPLTEIQLSDFDGIKDVSFYWVEKNIDKRVVFSYFLKFGASYNTKRNNSLFFNLVANYSPQKPVIGSYMIHATDGDSYGNFKQNINSLGLEVGYALTLCKKR